jgi:cytochrome b involved in lipid metabolism
MKLNMVYALVAAQQCSWSKTKEDCMTSTRKDYVTMTYSSTAILCKVKTTSVPQVTSTIDVSTMTITSTTSEQTTTVETLAQQLSKHNSLGDCWVTYNGNIYNLTPWVPKHPGGQNVYSSLCGTTGFKAAFVAQHGTTKESRLFTEAPLVGAL